MILLEKKIREKEKTLREREDFLKNEQRIVCKNETKMTHKETVIMWL